MSHESDSFIDEVTEEVRRDRLYRLFRRYGWIGLLVIAIIVGGAAWREYANNQRRTAAEAWGDAVLAAQNSDDPVAGLAALDGGGNANRTALGDLLAAGAAMEADGQAAAQPYLERAAAEGGDDVLTDLARLKAVIAAGESLDQADRDAALTDLSKPGAPFRLLALEQKAVALIAADRNDDALTLIREIQNEDGVSQALQTRLAQMVIMLGADLEDDPMGADATSPDNNTAPAPADAE
ncbi:tetratricopeptide repeat protein [Paracoccus sp. SCSIO 75233]|uniref:tetratricopeptide repeat protein n=1 Tax=Paracoccus sp. SCSIO 75233 TaxID=3017782 RepID=UPI0022F1433C|nr:tetratricopeptide repeat protein [Paracoccus sp. SCSIO 75233]WBU53475.1 tetratricopeptide repeat protein [Paracoccus sp. SCSIO 75233]